MIKFTKLAPLPDITDIERVERFIGYTLPAGYKRFLLEHNGGMPLIQNPLVDVYVQLFFAVTNIDDSGKGKGLLYEIRVARDELPLCVIPIALEGAGDRICLNVLNNNVLLWRHDFDFKEKRGTLEELEIISDSFDLFLRMFDDGENSSTAAEETSDELFLTMARIGDISALEKYIASGQSINRKTLSGRTLAQFAAMMGQIEFVKKLLSYGANTTGVLHNAFLGKHRPMIDMLLDSGMDINQLDETGKTPLSYLPPNHYLREYLTSLGAKDDIAK